MVRHQPRKRVLVVLVLVLVACEPQATVLRDMEQRAWGMVQRAESMGHGAFWWSVGHRPRERI